MQQLAALAVSGVYATVTVKNISPNAEAANFVIPDFSLVFKFTLIPPN
jgi:hypothetical protein